MGATWQTEEQQVWFGNHLAAYSHNSDEDTLKDFWPGVIDDWFQRWPVSEPPEDEIAKAKSIEDARKAWKVKKINVSFP